MIITSAAEIDRLGHYLVDNQYYILKSLAMLESHKKNKKLEFIYNDDVFSKYDWTREPEPDINLNEFYRRRAQQLRDKYDYIILQYSGGPDSHNVLSSFVNNDIFLDEIVNFNSYRETRKVTDTTHNADYVYNVKPTIERLLKHGSETRVTIVDEIDMTQKIFREFHGRGDYYELLFNSGAFPSVWMMRGIWVKYISHIWDMIMNGKKVCVVLGSDKTALKLDSGKYYTNFSDILTCDASALMQNDPVLKGHNILEMFYHTPDMPDLTIKQAHVLKKYVTSANKDDFEDPNIYSLHDFRPSFICSSKNHKGNLKYDRYHKTVYPSWTPGVITPKPLYLATRKIDCWWVDQFSGVERKVWQNGLYHQYKNFNGIIEKRDLEFTVIPLSFSKKYYLED